MVYLYYMNIKSISRLFWDVDTKDVVFLSSSKKIERTLTHGTYEEIHSLFKEYGKEKIKKVFFSMKKTAFTAKRHHYFVLLLE